METLTNPVDDFESPSPVLPWEQTFERAPTFIGVLRGICHPPRNLDTTCSEQRLLFLLAFIVRLQYPRRCENFAVSLGCFLRSNGLTRKGVEIMSHLGVCSSYDRILKAQEEQVRSYGTNLRVNVTYDNLDLMRRVNDERLRDHSQQILPPQPWPMKGLKRLNMGCCSLISVIISHWIRLRYTMLGLVMTSGKL
jgi:hypothetical protein